jgi:hypothetical protein
MEAKSKVPGRAAGRLRALPHVPIRHAAIGEKFELPTPVKFGLRSPSSLKVPKVPK